MENNENNNITELTLFDKRYATKDCSRRVLSTFVTIKEMENDAKRSNYVAVKDASAVEYQKEQLRKMIEEDAIEPMEDTEEVVVEEE